MFQLELEKQSEKGDVTNYKANGEFDLVNFSARRNIEYYSCCPEPYPDITYEIRLRRRSMFYVFNLILPCILINGIGKLHSNILFLLYSKALYISNLFSLRLFSFSLCRIFVISNIPHKIMHLCASVYVYSTRPF